MAFVLLRKPLTEAVRGGFVMPWSDVALRMKGRSKRGRRGGFKQSFAAARDNGSVVDGLTFADLIVRDRSLPKVDRLAIITGMNGRSTITALVGSFMAAQRIAGQQTGYGSWQGGGGWSEA